MPMLTDTDAFHQSIVLVHRLHSYKEAGKVPAIASSKILEHLAYLNRYLTAAQQLKVRMSSERREMYRQESQHASYNN